MVGKGVVVYGNDMKVGGGATRNSFVYGRPKKVISLSSPHRARLFGSTLPILTKLASLITYIMLNRNAKQCKPVTYVLLLSSILTVLLSCSKILGLMISMAI